MKSDWVATTEGDLECDKPAFPYILMAPEEPRAISSGAGNQLQKRWLARNSRPHE